MYIMNHYREEFKMPRLFSVACHPQPQQRTSNLDNFALDVVTVVSTGNSSFLGFYVAGMNVLAPSLVLCSDRRLWAMTFSRSNENITIISTRLIHYGMRDPNVSYD
jgi:hypothetical protein